MHANEPLDSIAVRAAVLHMKHTGRKVEKRSD